MRKNKKIFYKKQPNNKKTVRQDVETDYESQKPLLDFSLIDNDHEIWGFRNLDIPKYQGLIKKLSDFCGMTWQEILKANGGKREGNGNNSHDCKLDKFGKKAQKRLETLNMEDINSLFSLRLSGKVRIYGIRDRRIFRLIWYDPHHGKKEGVYPIERN